MPDFTRILCAVDFSEQGRRALDCALWWARRHGSAVSVLHVHPQAPAVDTSLPGLDAAGAIGPATPPAPLGPGERTALTDVLEAFVAGSRADGVEVELLVDEAPSVADAVLAYAATLACDLIVMSTTTGEVTEGSAGDDAAPALWRETAAVMRGASCPVLCIPAAVAGGVNPCFAGINRIVCPVTFSEPSRLALELAGALAAEATAHLTVLHVVELSEVASSAYDFDAYREARIEPACDDITTMISRTVGDATAVDEIVATGSPEAEILEAARDHDASLIVIGAGGAPVPAGGGHTLEKVVRGTRCPVLVAAGAGWQAAVRPEPTASTLTDGTGTPGAAIPPGVPDATTVAAAITGAMR